AREERAAGMDEQHLDAVLAVAVQQDAGAALGHAGRLSRVHRLEQEARELLDRNWREGTYRGRDYAFSVPSPRSYPWQWYWDSCFHAIVRRRGEPDRAGRELETLLNASRDGFIGHTIFWGHRIDGRR